MKALVITAVSGFIRAFLQSDIKTLQDMGYEVHCAADGGYNNNGINNAVWNELNVKFHLIEFDSKNPLSKKNLKAFNNVKILLKQEQFDLIHCHTPIAGLITRVAANSYRKKGTKVIYTTHGFNFHKSSSKKEWIKYYSLEKIASSMSDAIITINNEDYNNAKKMWCKHCFKINGVGVDTDRYLGTKIDINEYRLSLGIEPDDIMIVSAGELSERKNHEIIIKALGKIGNPKYKYLICGRAIKGSGTYDHLVELARKENADFRLLGFREDMPAIFACCDFSALPSTREGLGMAGIQSLLMGKPVLSSNVHGIVDYVIPGETGYSFDPKDVDGFVAGIKLLSKKETRERMKSKCVEKAMEFSRDVSINQMKNIYKEVIEIKGK